MSKCIEATEVMRRAYPDKDGYCLTYREGSRKMVRAHRLVYEECFGASPPMVCHICDNPGCVNPDHLFAGDALANNRDKKSKGRCATGDSQRRHSKLNWDVVRLIRRLYFGRGWTQERIGEITGMAQSSISNVVRGKTWTG